MINMALQHLTCIWIWATSFELKTNLANTLEESIDDTEIYSDILRYTRIYRDILGYTEIQCLPGSLWT
jgi:hypothetical protein